MRVHYISYPESEGRRSEKRPYIKVGFFGLLGIVFITLKLMGIIEWAWVFVIAPLWCPPVLAGIGVLVLALIAYLTQ